MFLVGSSASVAAAARPCRHVRRGVDHLDEPFECRLDIEKPHVRAFDHQLRRIHAAVAPLLDLRILIRMQLLQQPSHQGPRCPDIHVHTESEFRERSEHLGRSVRSEILVGFEFSLDVCPKHDLAFGSHGFLWRQRHRQDEQHARPLDDLHDHGLPRLGRGKPFLQDD